MKARSMFLIAALMVCTLLSGCGKKASSSTETASIGTKALGAVNNADADGTAGGGLVLLSDSSSGAALTESGASAASDGSAASAANSLTESMTASMAESMVESMAESVVEPVIEIIDPNELTQYMGQTFKELGTAFPGIGGDSSMGYTSLYLGERHGNRQHEVGMNGSEKKGVIEKINLFAGDTYMLAGIKVGMTLKEADEAVTKAKFVQNGEPQNGLTFYLNADRMMITVYTTDGETVDTVTCSMLP